MYYTTYIIHRQAYYEPIICKKAKKEQGDMHKNINYYCEYMNVGISKGNGL